MATSLKHLKVAPKEAHTATVIFLHASISVAVEGLGDSGHGWLPVAKSMWSTFPNVKWILPHAPTIPITINGGMRMPGWFDLANLDRLTDSAYDDEAGMMSSVAAVDALIQAEIDNGISEDRIVVGGFSQGGAVAILTAIVTKRRLAGVAALSTWVPLNHKVTELMSTTAKDLPIFWGHGKEDPTVRYTFGVRSVELLKKLGYPLVAAGTAFARPGLRFESYPGLGHSSSTKEMEDFAAWLTGALK
ncbi:MAG: hypothetical protein TREMPRED_001951 [Tremellales sp. Tagirdzhanova-0007]|nr:MAG: hypothetical protein TREMPRED_001951 [Tremellales sp. Tagirdzhanova-0007]